MIAVLSAMAVVAVMLMTAGAASASVSGTYSFQNGALPWVSPDSAASMAGDGLSATLWSRPLPGQTPSQTGSSYIFTPTSPFQFKDMTTVSASYDKLASYSFYGGTPRFVFLLDKNGNGILDDDYANVNIPWEFANGMGTGDDSAGYHNTGNVIGSAGVGWEIAHMGDLSNAWTTYATALSSVGDYKVLAVMIPVDGGWFTTQGLDVKDFNVVPEPATMALLAAGGIATLLRRRRSSKK
jgi:hypothetical protein